MSRVALLAGTVVDQIAAGEVVERPASVVKELLENALDAGATTIEITVEDGGRARIRVADDGHGMDREDALLALRRHATSKIRTADDLLGVASFGFRGEALPAIASVAHFELETAPADGAGTVIRGVGGEIVETGAIARRRGTTVTIARLFHNAPARQRFLRSARSEWRAIVDVLTALALTRRDVRLTVTHDARSAFVLPPANSLRARAAALWGGAMAERLVGVEDVSGPIQVTGLVERPGDVGAAGRRVVLVVNGRAIRDAGLIRAAESAYRSTIPAGARPTLLLTLAIPPEFIDVNVHPAKTEVRFGDRWIIERAVEHAVRRALGTGEAAVNLGSRDWFPTGGGGGPPDGPAESLFAGALAPPSLSGADRGQEPGTLDVPPLVQLRRTYLTCEREEGLLLIDQHSAHERVLYERFMRTLECGDTPSQRLLLPLTLHLGPAEGEAFDAHRELFAQLGFEIEGFGGHTLIVRSVPMPHPRFDAERCLRETLDALTGDRFAGGAARHERLAATIACKSAIKAGDVLAPGEMRALYTALADTRLPAHDVHGRATIVLLPWEEIERRFGRR